MSANFSSHPNKVNSNQLNAWLHGLMALGVVFQVLMIAFRELVGHHSAWSIYREPAIKMHQYVGIFVFLVIVIYLVQKFLISKQAFFARFYPLTKTSWIKIREDIFCLIFEKKLPVRIQESSLGGLSGLVQGLGLLLVLFLSGVGTLAMFSWYGLLGVPAEWGDGLLIAHKFFGGLIWWYLGGHIGMVLLHKITPERFQKEF
jgi:cytochrome b561